MAFGGAAGSRFPSVIWIKPGVHDLFQVNLLQEDVVVVVIIPQGWRLWSFFTLMDS